MDCNVINKPTPEQIETGYNECADCDQGVHPLQSGYEVETHMCGLCKCHVADRAEFFKYETGVTVLGK